MNFEPVLQSLFNPPKVENLMNVGQLATEVNKHWIIASTLRSTMVKNWKDDEYDSFTELGEYHGHKVCVEYHRTIVKNTSIVGLGSLLNAISHDKDLFEKIGCKLDGSESSHLFDINTIKFRTDFMRLENTSKFYKRHTCECFGMETFDLMKGMAFTIDDGSPIEVFEIGGLFFHDQTDGNLCMESIIMFASKLSTLSARCQSINSLLAKRWTMIKTLVNERQLPSLEEVGIQTFNAALKNHPFSMGLKSAPLNKDLRMNEYAVTTIILSEDAAVCPNGANVLDFVNPFIESLLYIPPDIACIPIRLKTCRSPLKELDSLDCAEFADFESLLAPTSSSSDDSLSSFYYPPPIVQPSFNIGSVDNPFSTFVFGDFDTNFNQQQSFNDQFLWKQQSDSHDHHDGMVIRNQNLPWATSHQYSNGNIPTSELSSIDGQSCYMGVPSQKRRCNNSSNYHHQQQIVPHVDESKSNNYSNNYSNSNISDQQLSLVKAVLENASTSISPELRQQTLETFNAMTNLVQKQKSTNSNDHNLQQQQPIEKQQGGGNHYNSFACSDGEPMIVDESNITVPSTPSISSQYSSSSSSSSSSIFSLSPIKSSSIPIPPKQSSSIPFQCPPSTLPSVPIPPKSSSPVSSSSSLLKPSPTTVSPQSKPKKRRSKRDSALKQAKPIPVSVPQPQVPPSIIREQIQRNLKEAAGERSARYNRRRYPKKKNPTKKAPRLPAGPSMNTSQK